MDAFGEEADEEEEQAAEKPVAEEVLVPVVVVVIDVVEWWISFLAVLARTATTSMVDVEMTSELASVV
jgi:hypothetical protein